MISKLSKYLNKQKVKRLRILNNSNNLIAGEYIFSKNRRYAYLNKKIVENKAKSLLDNDPLLNNKRICIEILNYFISNTTTQN